MPLRPKVLAAKVDCREIERERERREKERISISR
jgi:hypothetical protein